MGRVSLDLRVEVRPPLISFEDLLERGDSLPGELAPNQDPASSPCSAASAWLVTGPDPFVVRFTVSSWMTTTWPSRVKWTSSSM